MKTFAARYPMLFVCLSMLSLVLVQYICLFLIPGLSDATRLVSAKTSECLLAVLLVGALNWWRQAGFVRRWHWRDFVFALPLLFLPLLMIIFQINKMQLSNYPQLLLFAALAAMTGFAEETVFRGISIHALQPKGNMKAALITAFIFGLVHFFNLLQGANLLATIGQVVFAALIGIAFAAPLIFTGSIWPIIVIHAIQDFIAFWTTGGVTNTSAPSISDVVLPVVLILPVAIYGIWLIRRSSQTS